MRNIRITIEYDGKNFPGWQSQPGKMSIQSEIQKAIFEVTGEEVDVIASGRTDAGVHAKGFVANFKTMSKIPDNKYREAINHKLPDDIVILKSEEVDEAFHARYNARGKTYSYSIINRDTPCAINRDYLYHVKKKLNVEIGLNT